MRKIGVIVGVCCFVVLAGIAGLAALLFVEGQRPDYAWRPSAAAPAFVTEHPRVLIDESHHNASTAGPFGRYLPFARLLEADGFSSGASICRSANRAIAGRLHSRPRRSKPYALGWNAAAHCS
jgi:hypothetical protein